MIALKTQPDGSPRTRQQAVAQPPASRVVSRPVPESQARDPRGYQLEQLRRRFSPTECAAEDGSTSLVFKLVPSDPDFPFELAQLDCDVRVPKAYPEERPELRVRNKDIPRGFGINIERGWQRLVEERQGATLLALVKALDRDLEKFLSERKVETIKLVTLKDTRHLEAASAKATTSSEPAAEKPDPKPETAPLVPETSYTKEQVAAAKARRAQEVRQLEARMGRLPRFRRSADGVVFTLPMEPKRRPELPAGLRSVSSLDLIVPLLYPLQDLRIQLSEAGARDAEPVEELFVKKAAEQKQMSLTSHVNYLAQNLCSLERQARALVAPKAETLREVPQAQEDTRAGGGAPGPRGSLDEGKSQVQVIPRPPEWSVGYGGDGSEEDYSDAEEGEEGEQEEEDDDDDDDGGFIPHDEEATTAGTRGAETPERGTMMSFPSIELHGVELLEVAILNISVKCERCKTLNDMAGLKPGTEATSSCTKCATPLAATFTQQLVHERSSKAGFVELSGCRVGDMLASTFVPTCARCSTASPGLVSVRGETMTNVCRACHARFTFRMPEVKFLVVSAGAGPAPAVGPRRRTAADRPGLHAGEALPGRGTCAHYRRSYRWFRFSCCGRVHACDRCHDAAEDHANEWATRMVCGWCSREQRYATAACGFCGRDVVGGRGGGFWEGGRGTRDQRVMRRKDPRKYRRLGSARRE